MSDDIRKQATSTAGFIRAYGMFWRADRNESFAAGVKWTQVEGWQEDDYRARVHPVPGRGR